MFVESHELNFWIGSVEIFIPINSFVLSSDVGFVLHPYQMNEARNNIDNGIRRIAIYFLLKKERDMGCRLHGCPRGLYIFCEVRALLIRGETQPRQTF